MDKDLRYELGLIKVMGQVLRYGSGFRLWVRFYVMGQALGYELGFMLSVSFLVISETRLENNISIMFLFVYIMDRLGNATAVLVLTQSYGSQIEMTVYVLYVVENRVVQTRPITQSPSSMHHQVSNVYITAYTYIYVHTKDYYNQ